MKEFIRSVNINKRGSEKRNLNIPNFKILAFCLIFTITSAVGSIADNVYAIDGNSELDTSYVYLNGYSMPMEAPVAFTNVDSYDYKALGLDSKISPVDIFTKDSKVYVTCSVTNTVYVFDEDFKLVTKYSEISDPDGKLKGPAGFSSPEGVFVTDDGILYVADTLNERIVKMDLDGVLIQEYHNPGIKVLGEVVNFLPSKLVVDASERMYVVGKNVNRGIIELNGDGEFTAFVGAPKVRANVSDYLRQLFMTKEQKKRVDKFVPTEYNNVAIDEKGFLFGTIGSVDPGEMYSMSMQNYTINPVYPVVRLNPAGTDILRRYIDMPIIGELDFRYGNHSVIVDTAVGKNGVFSILDQQNGKVFTYDMYGNMLYVLGSQGTQIGTFGTPSSVSYLGDKIVVSDIKLNVINVYEPTDYGKKVNRAVKLDYDGKYDEAVELWKDLIESNSNLYLAYFGVGKSYYQNGEYKKALEYFKSSYNYMYYDKTKEKLRKEIIADYFPVMFGAVAVLVVAVWANGFVKKARRKKS